MSDSTKKAEPSLACADEECKRLFFGRVNFCPFCGAAQNVSGPPQKEKDEALVVPFVTLLPKQEPQKIENPPVLPQKGKDEAGVAPPVTPPPKQEPPETKNPPVLPQKGKDEAGVAPPVPPPPSKLWLWAIMSSLILLIVAHGSWQFLGSLRESRELEACQQSLQGVTSAMQSQHFVQARTLALEVVARCPPAEQARAKTLLAAVELAHKESESCNQALKLANSQIAEGSLRRAEQTLANLSTACAARPEIRVAIAKIATNRLSAAGKVKQMERYVADGQFEAARGLIHQAAQLDQDGVVLAQALARIAHSERVAAAQATVRDSPDPLPPAAAPPRPAATPPPAPAEPTKVSEQMMECLILVRAGKRALANFSFDIAMKNATDALKALANCPGAQELYDRARSAKDETRRRVVIY